MWVGDAQVGFNAMEVIDEYDEEAEEEPEEENAYHTHTTEEESAYHADEESDTLEESEVAEVLAVAHQVLPWTRSDPLLP